MGGLGTGRANTDNAPEKLGYDEQRSRTFAPKKGEGEVLKHF